MAKSDAAESREAAQQRVDEARAELERAQQAATEAGAGLAAATTRNIPEMTVEVLPGNHISNGGKDYYGEGFPFAPEGHSGNDQVSLDGPTALALMQMGHVTLVGPTTKGGRS